MSSSSLTCSAPTTGTATAAFSSALQFFTAAACLVVEDWPKDAVVTDGAFYDFIIVGAGSAGSVLANRLSEIDNWNILLIEAGYDPPMESIAPLIPHGMYKTKYDWNYLTANNNRTNKGNKGGQVYWPRGKMLGGTSSINSMVYIRGNDHDFQTWYNLGNTDWHPNVTHKYYKKMERLQNQNMLENNLTSSFYGHDGNLILNVFNNSRADVYDNILKSWDDIGIKNVPDINVAQSLGSSRLICTASNGTRRSTADTYLNPAKDRSNLHIIKNSTVSKILINETTNEAYGVEVHRNGQVIQLYSNVEVIVSAGTVNTPQLLMLSGVGPASHLSSKGITPIVDLPGVGQNLQDHLHIPITIYNNETLGLDQNRQYFEDIQYLYNRTGYLGQGGLGRVIAFFSTDENATYPMFQNHLALIGRNSSSSITSYGVDVANLTDSVLNSMLENNANHSLIFFYFHLLHPYSTGNITLKTADFNDHPIINANYLEDPRDLNDTVQGIKMLTKIINTDYFKSIGAFLGRLSLPACDGFDLDSTEYWRCICINLVGSTYHPVGTASMGPDSTTAVVNSKLKVYGVSNLRVIDASVMPTLTSGNTNGPTIMIGERAADLIKEEYNKT